MPYVLPSKTVPGTCTGCGGTNEGLKTAPYDEPLRHIGRYVDSVTQGNVQNLGLRTVRARAVHVVPQRNRLYVALGEAVGGYKLDTFFTPTKLTLKAVSALNVGKTPKGRTPLERAAVPDSIFYAESPLSGWTSQPIDAQRILADFDADERGFLYVSTLQLGWGLAKDHLDAGNHMEFIVQVEDSPIVAHTIFSMKDGNKFFAVISQNVGPPHAIYDVTDITKKPVLVVHRSGPNAGFRAWTKTADGKRFAVLDTGGQIRVYEANKLIAGTPTLFTVPPPNAPGKIWADIAFDPAGNLWFCDTNPKAVVTNTLFCLQKTSPTGYQLKAFPVIPDFSPTRIDASSKFIVLAGRAKKGAILAGDLRLLKRGTGFPTPVNIGTFFRDYYHVAPMAGFAKPERTGTDSLRLIEQGGKTFLVYSAEGLGDVFEIAA
ncbi:MAG: hypothetical protein ACLGH0_08715 [Thermoanaerobaculia bacterium]